MIALSGIAIQRKIYESSNSLVYRGIRDDGSAVVVNKFMSYYLTVIAIAVKFA